MPGRTRAPRKNPLIPVDDKPFAPSEVASAPAPMLIDSPICGQCWPDGWASLGDGDYASCPHGEWSKTEHFVKRAAVELSDDGTGPYVIDGVTTDGIPVKITIRTDGPALVSLIEPSAEETVADLLKHARAQYKATGETPILDMRPPSPFAPAPVEIDAEELDAGEDVMFMPSGG